MITASLQVNASDRTMSRNKEIPAQQTMPRRTWQSKD